MIPTFIVLGLIIAILGLRYGSLRLTSVALVAAALVFGVGIGISEGAVSPFFGGTGLAFVNLVVGAVMAAAFVKARRRLAA